MSKGRLEAFSDGVIAILITIMVLELKIPHGSDWAALQPTIPLLLAYALSFVYIGIYWNNHHHLLQAARQVNGKVLWANLHLLFWLSLVPFLTAWNGEQPAASLPCALYGAVLLAAALSYFTMQNILISAQGPDSTLREMIGRDIKGWLSLLIYLVAIPLAFVNPWLADGLYVLVALIWLVPDPRIERHIAR